MEIPIYRISGEWGWYEYYMTDEKMTIITDGLINPGYRMCIISNNDGGREWFANQTIERVKRYSDGKTQGAIGQR